MFKVRSFCFPGSTPVCGVFLFQNERELLSAHLRPGKKNATHRGRSGEAKREHPIINKFVRFLLYVVSFRTEINVNTKRPQAL